MEEKDKRTILDKWFLENEDCTYQKFCDIYNDGNPLNKDLPFFPIPKELRKIIIPYINRLDLFIQSKDLEGKVSEIVFNLGNYEYNYYVSHVSEKTAFQEDYGFKGDFWRKIEREWLEILKK
jgi:hypothetical protein